MNRPWKRFEEAEIAQNKAEKIKSKQIKEANPSLIKKSK